MYRITTTITFAAAALLVAAALLTSCGDPTPAPGLGDDTQELGTVEQVSDFGANPAQLRMFTYVPADMPDGPRPLVVAMHGCSMSASAYTAAGWHQMADLWKVYLVYPEQNSAVNNSLGCFNWGASWDGAPNAWVVNAKLHLEDLQRGNAENMSIKEMVDYMKDHYDVDDNRVYATGVSAGGGMTAVMLATWPDVFAGGAIIAGIPFGCVMVPDATTQQGTECTKAHPETHQLNRTPQEWGDLVRAAHPGYTGPYPVVSIWQGGTDFMVAPDLRHELVEQWTNVHGVDMTPDESSTVLGAEYTAYKNAAGKTVVEVFYLPGTSHTQPIDPGSQCGEVGAYISDEGICAAQIAGQTFGLDRDPDPNDPNDPGDPNDPNDPNDPGDPNDPNDPDDPGNPSRNTGLRCASSGSESGGGALVVLLLAVAIATRRTL